MASGSILIFGGVSEDNKIMMTKWGIASVHLQILGPAVDGRNPVKPCKSWDKLPPQLYKNEQTKNKHKT